MTTERETRNTNILKQNGDLIFTIPCMKWIALFLPVCYTSCI